MKIKGDCFLIQDQYILDIIDLKERIKILGFLYIIKLFKYYNYYFNQKVC